MRLDKRTVLVFRGRLLAPSETFIVEQAQALRHYNPVLVGLRRIEPCLKHSLPEVVLRDGSGTWDKIAARASLYAPVTPRFFRKLRVVNPSILHAHFATDAAQALPIAKAFGLPLIVSLHGYDVTPSDADLAKSFSGRYYLSRRQQLFAYASAFVCVSRSIREAALRAGFPEEKLHVHYTGVDCERFRPVTIERDPKLILFVGRLVKTKGCEYLLHAMSLVQQEDPRAHLEIIGDGPLRPALEALAKKLALHVRFRGVQPVVSCMHSAIPEAVSHGETGLLCPEEMPGPLAAALLAFLKDEDFWKRASARSITWVREYFDIAKQTVKLEWLYDECRNK